MTDRYELLSDLEAELVSVNEEVEKLEKRQSALRRTITGIRELISLNGGAAPAKESAKPTISSNAFAHLSIRDAAILFLRTAGTPQTNRQVTDAIKEGGIKTTSDDFASTVRAVLLREHNRGKGERDLYWKVPHWHLAEWGEQETEETNEK